MNGRSVTLGGAMSMLCASTLGVGVLAFPRLMVLETNTASVFMTILGVLLASLSAVTLVLLGMRFPTQTIVEYAELLVGKWLSRLGSIVILLFFILLTALAAREFGEVVVTSVLLRTPIEITVIAMALLALVASRNEIVSLSYITTLYLPFIIAPVMVIVLLSFKNVDGLYLGPWLGAYPRDFMNDVTGMITIAALFQPSFIMTMVIPSMREPKKALRVTLYALTIAGVIYTLTMIATLGVFGTGEIQNIMWPTLELAKLTSIPGGILERLDALFLAVWVAAVFSALSSTYFVAVATLNQLVKLTDHKLLSVALFPPIYLIAMLPRNILQLYEIIKVSGYIGLVITLGYPLVLYFLAVIRGKRGNTA